MNEFSTEFLQACQICLEELLDNPSLLTMNGLCWYLTSNIESNILGEGDPPITYGLVRIFNEGSNYVSPPDVMNSERIDLAGRILDGILDELEKRNAHKNEC